MAFLLAIGPAGPEANAQRAPSNTGAKGEDDYRYGLQAARRGEHKAAIRYFKRAEKAGGLKGRRAVALFVNRGLVWHFMGKYKKAVADYDTALKLFPGNPIALNNRGWAREKLGQKQAAIRDYRAALKINPKMQRTRDNLKRLGVKP
ncbi:MAG: tetratricopeptide repeat protein [Alphaproteobacteria bacterium]